LLIIGVIKLVTMVYRGDVGWNVEGVRRPGYVGMGRE
jgi:hypothetical protein